MAKQFDRMLPEHVTFIQQQRLFFTASAAPDGRVNVSPKGLDTLRVFDETTVAYLDLTGSGNESAAHLRVSPRFTLMFCAFEGAPMILRLYGVTVLPGARQIIELQVELVQTSCGFGVPVMTVQEDRTALTRQAEAWGPDGLMDYWQRKNLSSIDGLPTGLLGEDEATGTP
jgi:hypothetical protein